MSSNFFLSAAAGFIVAVVLLSFLRNMAFHVGLLDFPSGRKIHSDAIPPVGGLAMSLAFCLSLFFLDLHAQQVLPLLSGTLILMVVGLWDDLGGLTTTSRFLAQTIVALIMVVWGGVVLRDLGAIGFGPEMVDLGWFALPLTVFATIGMINTVNMCDGLNGLAGSVAFLAALVLGVFAWLAGDQTSVAIIGLLLVVIFSFLLFNLRFGRGRPALVFMGDAGSMFLGFILAWLFIHLSQGESRAIPPVLALWFFALPLFDTVGIMLHRIVMGRSPFAADQDHFHHILLRAGFSEHQTVSIIILAMLVGIGVGITGHLLSISEGALFVSFLLTFACYFLLMERVHLKKRLFGRQLTEASRSNGDAIPVEG